MPTLPKPTKSPLVLLPVAINPNKGIKVNGLALFAGGGGLELGLSLALGTDYRTIAYVERECTSAAVLAANMERGWLDKAPVWDDVTTFTGDVVSPLVDNIDIVTAGFPCQPWSVAGQRKGTDDERWLWPLIFRLVCEIRPQSILLENVPGLLHGGIEHVLGDLASVGFDAEWTSVRASDVGAPHRRERVFVLGNSRGARSQEREINTGSGSLGLAREVKHWATPEARDWKGHTITENHPEGYNHTLPNDAVAWPTPTAREAQHEYTDEALIRKDGKSRLDMLGTMAPRWSTPTASDDEHKVTVNSSQPWLVGEVDHFNGRPVHKALKVGGKLSKSDQTSLPRLNPKFVEWLMGWPEGWVGLTS